MLDAKKPKLSWVQAVRDAWQGRKLEHFPHRDTADPAHTLVSSDDVIAAITSNLSLLEAGGDQEADEVALQALLERSRESLDEVKAQTEYQDQKAVRLLTVATLFVALAGVLINAFAQTHTLRFIPGGEIDWRQVLALPVYIGFAAFGLTVIAGALVTFHATQTRFRYDEGTAIKSGAPMSQIFFRGIIQADPALWARSFTEKVGSATLPAKDLSLRYAKNYILESYLVAAKAADKLRYLEASQAILAFSLKVLLVWLVILAVIWVVHPGDPKTEIPLKVQIAHMQGPLLT